MNMVTIIGYTLMVLVYAGCGYLAIKVDRDFNGKLLSALYDKGIKLADDGAIDEDQKYYLVDEYRRLEGIMIHNTVLRYIAIVMTCMLWPITAPAAVTWKYVVYCKLMKKANEYCRLLRIINGFSYEETEVC